MVKQHAIFLATGVDRPGVLDEVSQFLFDHGANIRDSRIVNLGGFFSMILSIDGESEELRRLGDGLPQLMAGSRMRAELNLLPGVPPAAADTLPYRLTASGPDQAGVLHRISHLMRVLGVNMDDLETRVFDGPDGACSFELTIILEVPRHIPVVKVREYLAHLFQELHIEWALNPV